MASAAGEGMLTNDLAQVNIRKKYIYLFLQAFKFEYFLINRWWKDCGWMVEFSTVFLARTSISSTIQLRIFWTPSIGFRRPITCRINKTFLGREKRRLKSARLIFHSKADSSSGALFYFLIKQNLELVELLYMLSNSAYGIRKCFWVLFSKPLLNFFFMGNYRIKSLIKFTLFIIAEWSTLAVIKGRKRLLIASQV